jgi:hypothetical protein
MWERTGPHRRTFPDETRRGVMGVIWTIVVIVVVVSVVLWFLRRA